MEIERGWPRLRESAADLWTSGEMWLDTLLPNIRAVAALLGDPAAAPAYEAAFLQRLQRVAAPLARSRGAALYASVYGDRLFGARWGQLSRLLIYGG